MYLEALKTVYHQPAQSAVFACGKYTKDHALYIITSAPVIERGKGEYLMEIAGADGIFHPANVNLAGTVICLTSSAVDRPVMARYAWTDYAIVRLFGENGLPLAPFWLE